jgi:phosphoglycerate dehydrogenase-like enzyme
MRLVIYDPAFALYEPRLRSYLTTGWEIAADWGDEAWLRQELRGADALLANRFPRGWKQSARHLKALLIPGAGLPALDAADLPAECVVTNVHEHAAPVAEYVLYVMLRHALDIEPHAGALREGIWTGSSRVGGKPHGELNGKAVSILGRGQIGQAVARRAEAMGMTVRWKWSTGEDEGFWEQADYLVLACPLNESTRRLVGARELSRLRDGSFLVNVARAEIVDEAALFHALQSRPLGAALDVWWDYPSDLGEVRHGSRYPFHTLPNVVLTPHLAGWTERLLERRLRRIAANLDHLARGEALERVVLRGNPA